MGGGTFFERIAAYGERSTAREKRWAQVARGGLRWPVLGGVTALTLAAWWLSDWQVWPWLGAVGVLLLLGVTGAARRVGLAWTLAACLAVVALWLLLVYVSPWWWLLLAGVVLLVAAVTAAAVLRLRERRAQTLAALGIGLAMVAGGAAGPGVTAAEHERQEQAALDQQHQTSVARILPRTPGTW